MKEKIEKIINNKDLTESKELDLNDFQSILSYTWTNYPFLLVQRFIIKTVKNFENLSYEFIIDSIVKTNLEVVQLKSIAIAIGRFYKVDILVHPKVSELKEARDVLQIISSSSVYSIRFLPKVGDMSLFYENKKLFKDIENRLLNEGAIPIEYNDPKVTTL